MQFCLATTVRQASSFMGAGGQNPFEQCSYLYNPWYIRNIESPSRLIWTVALVKWPVTEV